MKDKINITVLVSGGGTNLQSIIDHIKNGILDKAKIVQVISSNCNAYALKRAENSGIKGICINRDQWPDNEERSEVLIKALKDVDTDLIVLAGYMSILDPKVIEHYRNKIINIHPSLIPKYCGKGFYGEKVHQSVLNSGDKVTGVTIHFVDEGIDTGKIILQEQVPVRDDDTAESLAERVLITEHWILPKAIKLFCDGKL